MTSIKMGLTGFLLLASSSAFAITNAELASKCFNVGKAKIQRQAVSYGCVDRVNLNQVNVKDVDNRWFNPYKYIWYGAPADCRGQFQIIELVQYYHGECF